MIISSQLVKQNNSKVKTPNLMTEPQQLQQLSINGLTINKNAYNLQMRSISDKQIAIMIKVSIKQSGDSSNSDISTDGNSNVKAQQIENPMNSHINNIKKYLYGNMLKQKYDLNQVLCIFGDSSSLIVDEYQHFICYTDQNNADVCIQLKQHKNIKNGTKTNSSHAKNWKDEILVQFNSLRQALNQIKQTNKRQSNNMKTLLLNIKKNNEQNNLDQFKQQLIILFSAQISKIRQQFEDRLKISEQQTKQHYQNKFSQQLEQVKSQIASLNLDLLSKITPHNKQNPQLSILNQIQQQNKNEQHQLYQNNQGKDDQSKILVSHIQLQNNDILQTTKIAQTEQLVPKILADTTNINNYLIAIGNTSQLQRQPLSSHIFTTNDDTGDSKMYLSKSKYPRGFIFQSFNDKLRMNMLAYHNNTSTTTNQSMRNTVQPNRPQQPTNIQQKLQNLSIETLHSVMCQNSSLQRYKKQKNNGHRMWNCYTKYSEAHSHIKLQHLQQTTSMSIDFDKLLNDAEYKNNQLLQQTDDNQHGLIHQDIEQYSGDGKQIRLKSMLELLQFFQPNYNASVKMLSRLL